MEQASEQAVAIKPWDKLDGETGAAYGAFLVYRDLGTTRNLSAAYKLHLDSRDAAGEVSPRRVRRGTKKVPSEPNPTIGTVASGRWKQWAGKFSWRERAEAYDRHFASLRLAEHERRAKTFSASYAEKQEQFLTDLLAFKIQLLERSKSALEKGKLVDRLIKRVGRDANGEPVQQEERFNALEALKALLEVDKFLGAEVKGKEVTADADGIEDTWLTERLKQVSDASSTSPSPAKDDSTPASTPSTGGSPGR